MKVEVPAVISDDVDDGSLTLFVDVVSGELARRSLAMCLMRACRACDA